MIRKNLVQWQWDDYKEKHQHTMNLWLHIVAVPCFWLGAMLLVGGLYGVNTLLPGLVLCVISFVVQGIGHRLEKEKPTPFTGFFDFISRFLVEQFVNFPRFVFKGHWHKAL